MDLRFSFAYRCEAPELLVFQSYIVCDISLYQPIVLVGSLCCSACNAYRMNVKDSVLSNLLQGIKGIEKCKRNFKFGKIMMR